MASSLTPKRRILLLVFILNCFIVFSLYRSSFYSRPWCLNFVNIKGKSFTSQVARGVGANVRFL